MGMEVKDVAMQPIPSYTKTATKHNKVSPVIINKLVFTLLQKNHLLC